MAKMVQVETGRCIFCGKAGALEVPAEGYIKWQRGDFVQDAFPDTPLGEREQLISGTHPMCFPEEDFD